MSKESTMSDSNPENVEEHPDNVPEAIGDPTSPDEQPLETIPYPDLDDPDVEPEDDDEDEESDDE